MSWVEDWTVVAACRGMDPDELFVQGAAQNRAKTVCSGCPVRTECLADALDNRVEYGVWGGMTERERRALLRRRPEVRSWRQFLEAAKEKYERGCTPGVEMEDAVRASAMPQVIPRQRNEASFGRA
jgi:WhiB family redox-sensing transcriptional regulator